jgi:hypothetical protein
VSDVGDNAQLLGEAGSVVAARDAAALAAATLAQIAASHPASQGQRETIRARIIERFSVSSMVDQTLSLLNLPSSISTNEP